MQTCLELGELTRENGIHSSAFPLIMFAAALVACAPVWVWCTHRMTDGSDDPFGLFAAIACLVLAVNASNRAECSVVIPLDSAVTILLLFSAYAFTNGTLPMIVRAGFAVSALAIMISLLAYKRRLHLPSLSLILLALPLVATMQFYFGYPMRLLVAHVVAFIANAAGFVVHTQGTDLSWNGHLLGIDPVCSGVRMLWTSFFVCFIAAGLNQLSNRRTIVLSCATLGLALLGNVTRAANLFLIEVFRARTDVAPPEFLHSAIGLVLFAAVTGAILLLARKLSAPAGMNPDQVFNINAAAGDDQSRGNRRHIQAPAPLLLVSIGVMIAASQLFVPAESFTENLQTRVKIPDTLLTANLSPNILHAVALTANEKIFAESFPGTIAKYSDGTSQFIIRSVATPTRRLHPAEDCFRGAGYKVKTQPNLHDAKTGCWGSFIATNELMQLNVREQISDLRGNAYPDVSAWYWAAAFGKTHAPWRSVTIATPASPSGNPH